MRPALCPVLVGRDVEAGHLRAALAGALAGRGGMVLTGSEPQSHAHQVLGLARTQRLADDARLRQSTW